MRKGNFMNDENKTLTDKEKEYYTDVKKEFQFFAPFYDFVTMPVLSLRNRVVNIVGAKPGARVLDIATGTGKQAMAFARRGYDVNGVDLSEAMLARARKNNKYPSAKFEVADAIHLRFEDGSFDVVSVSFGLHEMILSIREKAICEIARVTKPGGIVVVVDWGSPRNKIWSFFVYHIVRLFERYYPEFIRSNLKGQLMQAGIEITQELPVLLGVAKIMKGTKVGITASA